MKQVASDKKKTYSQPVAEITLTFKDVIMVSAITDGWNDFQEEGELY